jgi:hypothetical protein
MRAPATGGASSGPIAGHGRGLLQRLRQRYALPAWSLAAGPALAAVLVALGAWLAMPQAGRGGLAEEASLGLALEKTESGKDAAVLALRPVLSFRSKDSAWCRQFELRYAAKQASHALACRNDSGRWTVVAATPPAAIATRPAGSEPRKVIDELVTARMGDQPLSRSDETAMIGKGWSRL